VGQKLLYWSCIRKNFEGKICCFRKFMKPGKVLPWNIWLHISKGASWTAKAFINNFFSSWNCKTFFPWNFSTNDMYKATTIALLLSPLTHKCQKTGTVTRTFKLIAVAQKALKLQYSTHYYYTDHKIFGSDGANYRSIQ